MDAPSYPPATQFEPPVAAPYELSTRTASLAELMSSPAAWAIVLKHAPMLKMAVSSSQAKPHLANMTCETFINIGLMSRETADAIDQDLRALPRDEWPAQ